jgi:hypothetical protein
MLKLINFGMLSVLCFDTDKVGSAPRASTWRHIKWHLDEDLEIQTQKVGGVYTKGFYGPMKNLTDYF